MKKQYILSAVVAAASLAFASCDKEEMYMEPQQPEQNGNGDFIINPEDTAGIVVPEGYGLVVFPGNRSQTRASLDPITGKSDRISSLSILIYKKDESGTFKYVKEEEVSVSNSATWPLSHDPTTVQEYGTYRAVFVGNMDASLFGDEEVLTGVGEGNSYEDARINLPSIEKFNETNLFHWFSSDEFEVTENPTVVPVTLQRIVTRSSLTTYGIQEGISVSGADYPSRFYASLLEPEHESGFYDIVFGKGSLFEKALQEMLERDIIFPAACCLDDKGLLDKSKGYASWYQGLDKDAYLMNYVVSSVSGGNSKYTNNAYESKEAAEEALSTFKTKVSLTEDNKEVINNFLEALYKGDYTQQIITGIIGDDFSGNDGEKSFTAVKQAVVGALKEGQNKQGAVFPVWSGLTNLDVQLSGTYPSAINFDLDVVGEDKTFTQPQTVALSSSTEENADKTLNIYLLGSTDEEDSYTFGLESLSGNGITFPITGISGQILQPNTWTNYRLVPSGIQLGEKASDNTRMVIVSYYHLTKQITNAMVKTSGIKFPLLFSNNLGSKVNWSVNVNWWNIDDETRESRATGTIMTSSISNQDKVGLFFKIPDFSPENLTGNLEWKSK